MDAGGSKWMMLAGLFRGIQEERQLERPIIPIDGAGETVAVLEVSAGEIPLPIEFAETLEFLATPHSPIEVAKWREESEDKKVAVDYLATSGLLIEMDTRITRDSVLDYFGFVGDAILTEDISSLISAPQGAGLRLVEGPRGADALHGLTIEIFNGSRNSSTTLREACESTARFHNLGFSEVVQIVTVDLPALVRVGRGLTMVRTP